jgi:hypothetical protein
MGVLHAVCGEGSMWFCGIVSLDTLGVLGSELVWGKVGSLFSGVFRSYGGLTKRSGGVGISFRHIRWLLYGRWMYGLNNEVKYLLYIANDVTAVQTLVDARKYRAGPSGDVYRELPMSVSLRSDIGWINICAFDTRNYSRRAIHTSY